MTSRFKATALLLVAKLIFGAWEALQAAGRNRRDLRFRQYMVGATAHNGSNGALAKLLQKLNIVSGERLARLGESPDTFPISLLASEGALDEWSAIERVAAYLNLKVIRIEKRSVPRLLALLDEPLLASVPLEKWRASRTLPLSVDKASLSVVMANPLNHEFISALSFDLGYKVTVFMGREAEILAMIDQKQHAERNTDLEHILADHSENSIDESGEADLAATDHNAAPVIRLVNKILSQAIDVGASDIHLNPEPDGLHVRVRVDGMMRTLFTVPRGLRSAATARLKLLAGMDISERRKPQDGRLRLQSAFGIKDLRFSSVPTAHGENIVIRILSSDQSQFSFESLGMTADTLAGFRHALQVSSRIILVTGPTGSGKSSTLYAALRYLNDGTCNIVTVEDPVEYRIQGLSQIQVNLKTGLTFAEGLRSILRQDPDVIMVGEIRDAETATIAIQAAQTGHLVLSTIHTTTAAAAITRLRDLGVPPFLISSSLACSLSQRLVRKICSACKGTGCSHETKSPQDECEECNGTGCKGRTAIYSLLSVTPEIREAIRDEASEEEIEKLAANYGFQTLWQAADKIMTAGTVTKEEVQRVLGPRDASQGHSALALRAMPQADVTTGASQAEGEIRRRKILLVEDDEDVRAVFAMLLKSHLYDVTEAENGLDALEKVYAGKPDVIVCDLMMPRLGGMEFVRRLRTDARLSSIPVLILTAASSDDNHIQSLQLGADDFVPKTADYKILLAHVEKLF